MIYTINKTDTFVYVCLNLFSVLLPKKELSFVYATDMDEDFVQVIYNKQNKASGWVYKEDNFQFLPWITFYNMYGRKYGLRILKESPNSIMDLHSKREKNSQKNLSISIENHK